MTIKTKALVLDLDDTLYAEIDYLKSAYTFIAKKLSSEYEVLSQRMFKQYQQGENVFEYLKKEYNVDVTILLDWYRFHEPNVQLFSDAKSTLHKFSHIYKYAIITDGRSKTQRNKISALRLNLLLESLVISEEIGSQKPSIENYKKVMTDLNCDQYIYIGDNLKKDFITAKQLGWITICLKDQGQNIHKQDFALALEYHAHYCFASWGEINCFLETEINSIG